MADETKRKQSLEYRIRWAVKLYYRQERFLKYGNYTCIGSRENGISLLKKKLCSVIIYYKDGSS